MANAHLPDVQKQKVDVCSLQLRAPYAHHISSSVHSGRMHGRAYEPPSGKAFRLTVQCLLKSERKSGQAGL